jgi:hypothetical protein
MDAICSFPRKTLAWCCSPNSEDSDFLFPLDQSTTHEPSALNRRLPRLDVRHTVFGGLSNYHMGNTIRYHSYHRTRLSTWPQIPTLRTADAARGLGPPSPNPLSFDRGLICPPQPLARRCALLHPYRTRLVFESGH